MSFSITVQGKKYLKEDISVYCGDEKSILKAQKWLHGEAYIEAYTSGSTGEPKKIQLSRSSVISSARNTIEYFNLTPGSSALLCLNPDTIGGMMMIYRAIVGEWNLTVLPATLNPLEHYSGQTDFTSMVPAQLQEILRLGLHEELNKKVAMILLGGSIVSYELLRQITTLSSEIYHGYGMTETASHIALRKLNGGESSEYYQIFKNIEASVNEESCLKIRGEVTGGEWVQTTDVVELAGNRLKWLGRNDFAINSGGYKILPETIEKQIREIFSTSNIEQEFILTGIPDSKWGEILVFVSEGEQNFDENWLLEILKINVPHYQLPKKFFTTKIFDRNPSGKILRKKIQSRLI